jgi:hypothetical protein
MIDPRFGITDFKRCEDVGPRLGGGRRGYQVKVVALRSTSEILLGLLMSI